MTGSLAQTIQGEAGSNPAAQFAVASTIYNRMNAGTFPGGSDPNAIVNAPQQFVGFSATPNSSAQTFAAAIQNGTLSNYGSTGNAVNFQSGQTAVNNGFTNGGANIGGNYFSDQFGAPTSNFVAPSYTGQNVTQGPADVSSGLAAGSNNASGDSVTQGGLGSLPWSASGTGSQAENVSTAGVGQGTPVTVGVQQGFIADIGNWIKTIMSGTGGAFTAMTGNLFGSLQNWFIRAFVIIVGLVVLAIGLFKLMDPDGAKLRQLSEAMA